MSINPAYSGTREEIVRHVPESAQRVLDLGCATGALGAALLADRADRSVVGVEVDPASAAEAASRLSRVHAVAVEALDWDAVGADGPYDCVVAADVLEHLQDPDSALGAAVGVLAPGGTVVVSVPNIRHVTAGWSIFVRGTFPRRDRGLFDATHLRWFTTADVLALCARCGLRATEIDATFRVFDGPGGRVNDIVRRQRWIRRVPVLRQLLAYQVIVVATPVEE